MKKHILLVALLLTGKAFSQSFSQSNEPQIGTSASMYIADSLTSNKSAEKGDNITWDYSSLSIDDTTKRLSISIVNPSTTKYASLYKNATKAIIIENFITSYYSSTSNERSSLGYYFQSGDLGDVRSYLDKDVQITHTYPFGLSNSKSDNMSGTLYYTLNTYPMSPKSSGTSFAEVDGIGNLQFNSSLTVPNVIRYHIFDSTQATLTFPGIGTTQVVLKRDQYEYYDLANSNLPIFTHTNLKVFTPLISPDALIDKTVVLSKYKPYLKNASTTDNVFVHTKFNVFPNPSKENINIQGIDNEKVTITISDQSGKIVTKSELNSANVTIPVSSLENGVYFIAIESNQNQEIHKFHKF